MKFIEPIDYVKLYGPQTASDAWATPTECPPSPHRIRHLAGEPDPLALAVLFANAHGRERKILARRYFGKGRPGPK